MNCLFVSPRPLRRIFALLIPIVLAFSLITLIAVALPWPAQAYDTIVGCDANLVTVINSIQAGGGGTILVDEEGCVFEYSSADNNGSNGSNALPVITTQLTISGNGATLTRSDGADAMRFFEVTSSGVLTLENLILTGGATEYPQGGGAILVAGGQATLLNSILSNNVSGHEGGACWCDECNLTISHSQVFSNQAQTGGGCSLNGGNMSVSHSEVYSNQAHEAGGLRNLMGYLRIEDSRIFSNNAISSTCGGIQAEGGANGSTTASLVISSTEIYNNQSVGDAGGIHNAAYSVLQMRDSTLSGNLAQDRGGGIFIDGNRCDLVNTTLSDNQSQNQGGGIYLSGSTLMMTNTTIANNESTGADAGGLYNSGTLESYNSILAGNQSATGNADCEGSVATGDNNLAQHDGCGFVGSGNIEGKDAVLGPLQDNGGTTRTRALLADSPALDSGNNSRAAGLGTDQRGAGFARIAGGTVDMGAFELNPCRLSISKTAFPESAMSGQAITYTLRFSNTGPDLATGIRLTDIIPASVTVQQVLSSGVPITCTGGSPAYVWQVGTMALSQTGLITLTGVLSQNLPPQIFTNTALISAANALTTEQARVAINVGSGACYLPLLLRY